MYGHLRFDLVKKRKQNHHTFMDFCVVIIKKIKKKSCDKCVFVIKFFNVFKKHGNETRVNLQYLVSKNYLKITILSCVFS